MTTIRINGIDYNVIFTDIDDENLIVDDSTRAGSIHYITGNIYILKTLPPALMRQTIAHELTHAYICAFGFMRHEEFDHEQLCDFMAAYASHICYDTDAVMGVYNKEEVAITAPV
jgi:hypothetical protein